MTYTPDKEKARRELEEVVKRRKLCKCESAGIDLPLEVASVIYICGPMQSHKHDAYNFKEFFYFHKLLEMSGFAVINPAHNDCNKMLNEGWQYTDDQWNELIEEDCALIRHQCQGVFVLKGYECSKGALREIATATENMIPVFYENDYTN